MDNNITKFPDAYYKLIGGNLYNLMQLEALTSSVVSDDFKAVENSRELDKATGKTLDNYGSIVGETRNGATDEQYLTKILNKIAINSAGTDVNSIINTIIQTLRVEQSDLKSYYVDTFTVNTVNISIKEGNGSVTVKGLSEKMVNKSGYSEQEVTVMIKELMPIGVNLERTVYAGTLEVFRSWFSAYPQLADQSLLVKYPLLWTAWYMGQLAIIQRGSEIGLSGDLDVPPEFAEGTGIITKMKTQGAYDGGTLSALVV